MKKRVLSLLLAFAFAMPLTLGWCLADEEGEELPAPTQQETVPPEAEVPEDEETPLVSPYPDINVNADYAEAVIVLTDIEIFVGDEHGNFRPDAPITRAEAAAVLCRLRGETVTQTDGNWADGYVQSALAGGFMPAADLGADRLTDPVTGQEMARLIAEVLELDIFNMSVFQTDNSVTRSDVAKLIHAAII